MATMFPTLSLEILALLQSGNFRNSSQNSFCKFIMFSSKNSRQIYFRNASSGNFDFGNCSKDYFRNSSKEFLGHSYTDPFRNSNKDFLQEICNSFRNSFNNSSSVALCIFKEFLTGFSTIDSFDIFFQVFLYTFHQQAAIPSSFPLETLHMIFSRIPSNILYEPVVHH